MGSYSLGADSNFLLFYDSFRFFRLDFTISCRSLYLQLRETFFASGIVIE